MGLINEEKLLDEEKLVNTLIGRLADTAIPAAKVAATELLDGLSVTFTATVSFARKPPAT